MHVTITWALLQMEMLRGAVLMLHAQCDQCLTKVERIFPASDNKEGIGMVVLMASTVFAKHLFNLMGMIVWCEWLMLS